jgi:glycosyltransferase involved in cell wall biosynthesis
MYTPTSAGGHAQYTWELMTALSRLGSGRAELVTGEDLDPRFRTAQYPVHPILPTISHRKQFRTRIGWAANRVLHYPRCERRFLEWLRGRPDIAAVHFQEHTSWRAGRLFRAVKAMGKSVYYTVHNVRPHAYPPFIPTGSVDRWDRDCWNSCDGLFVLSPRLREELAGFLGGSHPPIHVAPHGVWTVGRHPDGPSVAERLSFKRLLFFGAIRRNKGLDVLLRAAELLPEYSLTIAGEPREREYFESEVRPAIERLRAQGARIDLIDRFVPDEELPQLFARHSAVVLPYTNGFTAQSGAVFMALAYDMPVVASEVGGLRDLFDEFAVGTTFAAQTPDDLARAVRELHADANRDRLASEIRAAKRKYSWDEAACQTARAYGWVAQPVRACA